MIKKTLAMGKNINNQSGFGATEGLLIVLILAVVGFGGYNVWHSRHSRNSTTTPASSDNAQPSAAKQVPAATTTAYTNASSGYSVRYPNQWSMEESNTTEGTSNTVTAYRVNFKSPDYQLTNTRFPTAMAGGDFFIMQTHTTAASINDYTASDSADKGITWPADGRKISVDGVNALRGTCADASGPNICIAFVKNNSLFKLSYYYNNQEAADTAKYLQEFDSFVNSFKFQ